MASCFQRRGRKTEAALTLLELLIAVTLVAVVLTILFAATRQLRKQTGDAATLAHLRQIGSMLHSYIADHGQTLPPVQPAQVKALAAHMGYIHRTNDWSNDASTPKNSIFRNGADEATIRKIFVSSYDRRPRPDPLNSYAFNASMGFNPASPDSTNALRYSDIKAPSRKIYVVPAVFRVEYHQHFSESRPHSPFRSELNPEEKGHFPALFADGHAAMVDPAPPGMSTSQINLHWIRARAE